MFESDQLEIADGLPESSRLVEELVRYGRDGSFGDDLALALALACWKLRYDYPLINAPSSEEDESAGMPTRVRKGPLTARDQQRAAEFVGMIMGVPAKRYRE